jgi:hypothetical protein
MAIHWTGVSDHGCYGPLLYPQVADGCVRTCYGRLYSCTNSTNCILEEGVLRVHTRLQVSPHCAVVRGNLLRHGSSTSTAVTYKRWLWPWSPTATHQASAGQICQPVSYVCVTPSTAIDYSIEILPDLRSRFMDLALDMQRKNAIHPRSISSYIRPFLSCTRQQLLPVVPTIFLFDIPRQELL